jgi:hypothetical protein
MVRLDANQKGVFMLQRGSMDRSPSHGRRPRHVPKKEVEKGTMVGMNTPPDSKVGIVL